VVRITGRFAFELSYSFVLARVCERAFFVMKQRVAVVLALVGAAVSSVVAMALPVPRANAAPSSNESGRNLVLPPAITADKDESSHLSVGSTLLLDARLGHASLASTSSGSGGGGSETYLFASVTGVESQLTKSPPLDLALVVDRSGSMKGQRIANAMAAATTAVDRMHDGDSVLVVSFDTQAQLVLAPTVLSPETRPVISAAIHGIRLGGDTCISCGLEEAKRALDRAPPGTDRIRRMLLLSDGATNNGIRDVAGLRILASLIREHSCPITTIGVDLDYDEKVMGAIATESNGNHYFVASADALTGVFNQEFDKLAATVAHDAMLVVEPAPGVVIEEVFDRAFKRGEGGSISVPLGTYSAKDEKSLLLKLRVPVDHDGRQPVAGVKLAYRDLRDHRDANFSGALALTVKSDGTAQKELDPFVQARVERSRTARALAEAGDLINKGRADEARAKLAAQSSNIVNAQQSANKNAATPSFDRRTTPTRARGFGEDFDDQVAALEKAKQAANAAASAKKPNAPETKNAPKVIEHLNRADPFR
jgi:Ca-activated chloride channel homolog